MEINRKARRRASCRRPWRNRSERHVWMDGEAQREFYEEKIPEEILCLCRQGPHFEVVQRRRGTILPVEYIINEPEKPLTLNLFP